MKMCARIESDSNCFCSYLYERNELEYVPNRVIRSLLAGPLQPERGTYTSTGKLTMFYVSNQAIIITTWCQFNCHRSAQTSDNILSRECYSLLDYCAHVDGLDTLFLAIRYSYDLGGYLVSKAPRCLSDMLTG
jgi:hypothetical protein